MSSSSDEWEDPFLGEEEPAGFAMYLEEAEEAARAARGAGGAQAGGS